MRILEAVKDLMFPGKCLLCGRLLADAQTDLCADCRSNAPYCGDRHKTIPFVDKWEAVWYYEEQVRESLLRYKFSGKAHYAQAYGRFLALRISQRFGDGFDVLTYVPVSARRRFSRGYDQVRLLAQAVGDELGCGFVKTLRKVRHNVAQSSIKEDERRRANVLGVYRVRAPDLIRGKRVLLLDDIITTGSTVSECAKTLKLSGATEVLCAAMATRRSGNR